MAAHSLQPRRSFGLVLLGAFACLLIPSSQGREKDKVNELVLQAEALLSKSPEKALELANQAIKLDPKTVYAYQVRGVAHFKLGKVKESASDFDEFVKRKPERKNGHWQRGISLYYAGRFEDGKKQFEGYEEVDTNDVENAIWHFLCNARLVGIPKAREQMLKIGKDRRGETMMRIYDLYRGRCKPEDVLAAARTGEEDLRKQQLFYANLYLGIYAEIEGNRKQALEYLEPAATRYRIDHYMGDVARVHRDLLKKTEKEEKRQD
jgi:lipoprotein NlpI